MHKQLIARPIVLISFSIFLFLISLPIFSLNFTAAQTNPTPTPCNTLAPTFQPPGSGATATRTSLPGAEGQDSVVNPCATQQATRAVTTPTKIVTAAPIASPGTRVPIDGVRSSPTSSRKASKTPTRTPTASASPTSTQLGLRSLDSETFTPTPTVVPGSSCYDFLGGHGQSALGGGMALDISTYNSAADRVDGNAQTSAWYYAGNVILLPANWHVTYVSFHGTRQ